MSADNSSYNPWVSIWTSPRSTIARIVQENPNRGLWWLAFIYGFSGLLNTFQSMFLGRQFGLLALFLIAAVLGPLWGYVSFSVWSWVVSWTGKWLKGAGEFKTVRAAYAWSCFPLIVNVVLWFALAALFGRSLFTDISEGYPLTQGQMAMMMAILLIRLVVAIWSLVIYLNALAEVQKFSVLRAIGNVVIAGVLIAIVFYLAVFLLFGGWQGHPASHFFLLTDGAAIETLRHL